jgi:hypothetical protein
MVVLHGLGDSLEGYRWLVPTLYAGKSSVDSMAAMKFILDTDYEFYGGFLQGMLGANPRHEPQIGFDRVQSAEDRYLFGPDGKLVYRVGHVFTLQMHIVDKQHTRGLFLGDFFAIEEKPALLNSSRPSWCGQRLSQEFQAYKLRTRRTKMITKQACCFNFRPRD